MLDSQKDWEAKYDADVLKRAAEIKNDPKRAAAAAQSIQNDVAAAESVLKENGSPANNPNIKGKVTLVNGIPQFG